MAGFFEQFVAFGTDIVGLERLMRLVQSVLTLLSCRQAVVAALVASPPEELEHAMLDLARRLNLTRRAVRLFWCLGSLQSSVAGYGAGDKTAGAWLSAAADSLFGLFGLVESATLLDLVRVPRVEVMGYAGAVRLDGQAQGLWLAALVCAALRSGVGMLGAAAPFGGAVAGPREGQKGEKEEGEEKEAAGEKESEGGRERRRRSEMGRLARGLAAQVLDMAIPASRMGLVHLEQGTVAAAMLLSTFLTGYAVWERCGLAVDAKRA